jgi:hypothetical protein
MDHNSYGKVHLYQGMLVLRQVIMAIMLILVVDLLCQTVMRHPSVLECLLSSARGYLWPCLFVSGI